MSDSKVHGSMRPGDDVLCRCGHIRGYHSFGALGCMADPDCKCKGFKDPCVCAIAWASPTPRPVCPTHGRSSLMPITGASEVESLDKAQPFKPPICFLTNYDSGTYARSDAEWKRDTFPQETQ